MKYDRLLRNEEPNRSPNLSSQVKSSFFSINCQYLQFLIQRQPDSHGLEADLRCDI